MHLNCFLTNRNFRCVLYTGSGCVVQEDIQIHISVLQIQFAADIAAMGLDGHHGQIQGFSNFLGGSAGLDKLANFHFRRRQVEKQGMVVVFTAPGQFEQLIFQNFQIGAADGFRRLFAQRILGRQLRGTHNICHTCLERLTFLVNRLHHRAQRHIHFLQLGFFLLQRCRALGYGGL